jgi:acyl carrier protein phosphodiesterase
VNWLAHLRLAPPAPPLLRLGNLAGDFVRGVDVASLHEDLQRGIAMHRAIDRFVDAHPAVLGARAELAPDVRRFGGVLLDVWFDHFLARQWQRLGAGGALGAFLREVHAELAEHRALLPPDLQRIAGAIARDDWLGTYATVDGIEQVLTAMARRFARASPLARGGALLRERYGDVERTFDALWPDVTAFAASLR